ncbi:MAG: hypothetical protein K0S76_1652 [Herbinix sp.]|jgi:glycosyltransferase involved in cell wall biosynthesis|nr:hypothetical protein [Herbinix sp.]
MKVLWVTNLIFPVIAKELKVSHSASGGWLYYFAELLSQKEDISLGIVSVYSGKEYKVLKKDRITYFLLPINARMKLIGSGKIQLYLRRLRQAFHPDIIHIHGAELPLGLYFLDYFPNTKVVVNIQTLSCRLEKEMDGGLKSRDFLRYCSPRECLKLKSHSMRKLYARLRTVNEHNYFQRIRYVIGSTLWDETFIRYNYPHIKYFRCQYLFRESFYKKEKWSYDQAEPNSIITGQAATPSKGMHVLLKAVYYVKKEISDVRLYIPGPDMLSKPFLNNYSYAKYLRSLIARYKLDENVIFTGSLSEEEMADRMKKSRIVVVPSAVELGSSVLCEAMLLGVPVIAAFRGGMTEKFQHGISGYYYDYPEVFLLAEYMGRLLTDKKLASDFSVNEIITAQHEHGYEKCCREFYETYRLIYMDGREVSDGTM